MSTSSGEAAFPDGRGPAELTGLPASRRFAIVSPEVVVAPHAERPIPAGEALGLYRAQGWWPERTARQVGSGLSAGPAVGAWYDEALVGFARAVTDGMLRAYVEDVVVAERFRGAGVGHALVRRLLDELSPIPVVSLFCARELVPFYETADFRPTTQVVLHRL